jgi:hypothetical protein
LLTRSTEFREYPAQATQNGEPAFEVSRGRGITRSAFERRSGMYIGGGLLALIIIIILLIWLL